ncbi:helix-turn-helix transcriptional regulator [Marinobacter litoralis]|uniref:helix-turn-helix transcriptional regulator n=1 Tax=Marinobacter litoralis TaxID=187981 RepID=UPI0018ECFDC1|nr:helix-turn-helix transcriptional regulator [Marinobacter litoralis]MBJ6138993.1 helix-turn-helix transcriptional regulator [Marinobacter litoralis]
MHNHGEHRAYRIRDFRAIGEKFDIDYHFPNILQTGVDADKTIIAEGRISEYALSSGFRFTFSQLDIREPYESVSLGHAPLLILLVLEGHIHLKIGALERELESGSAVTMQLHPEYPLQATQKCQQRLNTVALAFDPKGADVGRAAPPTLLRLLSHIHDPVHTWSLPDFLITQLANSYAPDLQELQQSLLLEGLALQLTGLGIPKNKTRTHATDAVSSPQRERLELVRQKLEFAPHQNYSFSELARIAAMSPSSLRTKFRATYGLSPFDYLRRYRLELARQYLNQGFSVQQTAHKVGYRHATNFATAFRHEFGVSPKKSQ